MNQGLGGWPTPQPPSIVGLLSAFLVGSVGISTSSFTDILSLALTPGTWVVYGSMTTTCSATTPTITSRLSDGTNIYAAASQSSVTNGESTMVLISESIVVPSSATIAIQARSSGTATAVSTTGVHSQTKATYLRALRIA